MHPAPAFLIPKAVRKANMVALVIFVGTILGATPNWAAGTVGALLFFIAYLNTYIYNDIVDLKDDIASPTYGEKVLAHGAATLRQFIALLGNLGPAAFFLVTFWDPVLGALALAAVLLNNLRTHIRRVLFRQALLTLVEFVNFEAFWWAYYETGIPAVFVPVFLTYALLYAASHGAYKLRSQKDLLRIVGNRDMRLLIAATVLSAIFAFPALLLSVYHFVILLIALALYAYPQYRLVARRGMASRETVRVVANQHHLLMLLIAVVLLASAAAYQWMGLPLRQMVPFSEQLAPYYHTAEYFDQLQRLLIEYAFGGIRGLKGKVM